MSVTPRGLPHAPDPINVSNVSAEAGLSAGEPRTRSRFDNTDASIPCAVGGDAGETDCRGSEAVEEPDDVGDVDAAVADDVPVQAGRRDPRGLAVAGGSAARSSTAALILPPTVHALPASHRLISGDNGLG